MTTALDLITSAFSDINESEAEAPIENFDAQLALTELNRLMASQRPNIGWTKATALDSTVTVNDDAELWVQKSLAKHLAGHYEVPVSNALNEAWRMARRDVMSRYVKVEPQKSDAPSPSGQYGYSPSADSVDRNNVVYSRKAKTVSSDYLVVTTDDIIYVDCTNGPVTISLMAAAGVDGRGFEIVKVDETPNQVIVDPDGTETIQGDLTYRFNGHDEKVEMVSQNGGWS